MKKLRAILCILVACIPGAHGYGPIGHEIVGGIADQLLAGKPAGARISALIDGITLEKASVIADEIKAWDKNGPEDTNKFPRYSDHLEIDKQLRDFWRANPPRHNPNSALPSHHWFHYTDVPVFGHAKYSDGKVGRSKWDVVHMIPYCISVLRGETPGTNERKITKPIAVILMAHYVGDIHQPLHVGAEYFDYSGRPIDPDKGQSGLADEGGNTFALHLNSDPLPRRGVHTKKFHGYWDFDAVNALLPQLATTISKYARRKQIDAAKAELIYEMASHEPKDWRMPPQLDVKAYAEAWADQILPIARDAHERLKFADVKPLREDDGRIVASGDARERPSADGLAYRDWAKDVVRRELHKAGWRLADLLEKTLRSTGVATTMASVTSTPVEQERTPSSGAVDDVRQSSYGEFHASYK